MAVLRTFLYLLVYPGILFLFAYSTFCEWFDRKLYARLQNRMGPTHTGRFGLLQPIADFFKLMAKEDVVPEAADKGLFNVLPAFGLAVVATAGLLLPVWNFDLAVPGWTSFSGDIIVMLYLLSLPTLVIFLAAWSSTNLFSTIGGARVLTMLFGYEVPLFLAVLSPAILAGSWRLAEIAAFYQARPLLLLVEPPRLRRRPHRRPGQARADALRHPPRRDRDRRRHVHRVLGEEAGRLPPDLRRRARRRQRPPGRRLPGRLPRRGRPRLPPVRRQDALRHLPPVPDAGPDVAASASTRSSLSPGRCLAPLAVLQLLATILLKGFVS